MLKSFYLHTKVYYISLGAAGLFILSYFAPVLFTIAIVIIVCLCIGVLVDAVLVYSIKNGVSAFRVLGDRLSNGDENKIGMDITNHYGFTIGCKIIDELPYQFQKRKGYETVPLSANEHTIIYYFLKPLERGEYDFGNINIYISSPLNLIIRRYTFLQQKTVKVYPSYLQMRRFSLLAVAHKQEAGSRRMRKLGHSMEFEQIKEYVRGDDYRTINWQATARKGDLMVNNFTDERSQQVYCIINKGRAMKMPFEGMTLLDYAINAALALSSVALQKQDRAGLITFAESAGTFLLADKKPVQINAILESLYKQQTQFLEPDFERLFSIIRNRITQRSLLVLFTNFESFESLQRQLPSLKRIAHYHLLMVIFFENTEVKTLTETKASTIEDVYIKTIADKYLYEKRLIVKELQMNGIIAVLTPPQKLTINALNKYLELKQRQSI